MEQAREALVERLRRVPYLEPEGDWHLAMARIGDVLGRAAPRSKCDDRLRAVEFTFLAAAGKTAESRLPEPGRYPSPQFLSELLWALTDRPQEYLRLPRTLISDLDSPIRSELARYFDEVELAIRLNRWKSTLDQPAWEQISALDILQMIDAYGVPEQMLETFSCAKRAIIHGFRQPLEFTYGLLPLVSVCLRWLSGEGLAKLSQDRTWALGIARLRRIFRIVQYLKAAERDAAALCDHDRIQVFPRQIREDRVYIPLSPVAPTLLECLWSGGRNARFKEGGWRLDRGEQTERPQPVFTSTSGISLKLEFDAADSTWDGPDRLWRAVEGLSPFTADVALAVLAEMVRPSHGNWPRFPLLQPVEVTADTILSYKRIRAWGAKGDAMRARVAAEMDRLSSLRLQWGGGKISVEGSSRREGNGDTAERLFHVVHLEYPGEGGPKRGRRTGKRPLRHAWLVRAGPWARRLLAGGARTYAADMARLLLEMDHREVRGSDLLAKKLGQWLVLSSMRPGGPERTRTIVIGRLLQSVGELPADSIRSRHWAGRIRERFDTAMITLCEKRIVTQVSWPDGHGPGDPDRERGWVSRWLAAKVSITLPFSTVELKASAPACREIAACDDPDCDDSAGDSTDRVYASGLGAAFEGESPSAGERLRRLRTRKGLNQAALASHLGVSRGYLSQIENGRRHPSKELRQRIRSWIREAT